MGKTKYSTASVIAGLTLVMTLLATVLPAPAAAESDAERAQRMFKALAQMSPQDRAALRAQDQMRHMSLKATSQFTCLPSCDINDGRFLAIAAGDSLATLSDPTLDLSITAPAGTTDFEVGIFDGDGGDPAPPDIFGDTSTRWDRGVALEFEYTLLSVAPGGAETVVAGPISSTTMPNDDWSTIMVSTGALTPFPSGIFVFRLEVAQVGALGVGLEAINAFKVRTDAIVTIRLAEQPFSYIARFNTFSDILRIYPEFPVLTTSTYDGDWSFFFDVESQQSDVLIWDGDFDRGLFSGSASCVPQPECLLSGGQDTDDGDTPGPPFLPLFDITADAVSEEVASGDDGTTGAPQDDIETAVLVRQPAARYDFVLPDERSFPNENPSGNREWEQFVVSSRSDCVVDTTGALCTGLPTDPRDPAGLPCADVCVADPQLPMGVYEVRADGVDMDNLNALRLPQVLCVDELGQVCTTLKSFRLGDTVFLDLDGNGVQLDAVSEPGINGVIVNLLDADGNPVTSTATGTAISLSSGVLEDGIYSFLVDGGDYTVQIAPENFGPAAAAGGAVGDRVWYDANADGSDAGEDGIGNVRVNLFNAGADTTVGTLDDLFVGTTLTDPDGFYGFSDLPLGIRYYADVVESTLPEGLSLTAEPDTGSTGLITGGSPVDLDLDFGYTKATAIAGDLVWSDANSNTVRDPGESGIGGVTLDLIDDATGTVVATTATSEAGTYLFTGILPGDYEIAVTDTAGILVDYTQTAAPTPPFTLAAGDANLDQDFGYVNAALFDITDRVYEDIDFSGTDNGGTETGIAGVTVNLLRAGQIIATAATDGSGFVTFPDLPDGTYDLSISDLGGALADRFETAFLFFGAATLPLSGADVIEDSFHYSTATGFPLGAVGDRVWLDLNANGVDDGEPGIPNVVLRLVDTANGVVGDGDDFVVTGRATDENGFYRFSNLPAFPSASATYYVSVVEETLPPGLGLSGGTDPSATQFVDSGQTNFTLDFGYTHLTALVGDLVWSDANNNGVRDAGESGIGGVTLDLIDDSSSAVVATTTSAADGTYLFPNVAPGIYTVDVTDTDGVLAGYTLTVGAQSNPDPTVPFVVAAGDTILTKDFGYVNAALFDITDRVWFDADSNGVLDGGEVGIGGVTVVLLDAGGNLIASTVTDTGAGTEGTFSFPDLPDGDYTILITDDAGGLAALLPTTPGAVISEQGVTLAGADVVGTNFGYNDTGALSGLVGTTLKDEVTNVDEQSDTVSDDNVPSYDFGYIEAGSLGDRVWFDIDGDTTDNGGSEPGLGGVTVTLTNAASGAMETTTTNAAGFYTFGGLRPTDSGLPGDVYVVTVDDSTLPAGFTVRTFDLDGTGTADTADAPLGTQAPGIAEDRTDVDFGYRGTGSIGDRVWNDLNGDQGQGGETGINGVTVELLDSTGTVIATQVTVPDGVVGDGKYLFEGLPPGDYTVRVVPPAGFSQTFDLDGTLDDETPVTLGLGENRTDVDFGYQQANLEGSIGDRVWNDIDGDGVQDAGEDGINDVTVRLFNAGGGLEATDVTSGDGDYDFPGLTAGTYTVVVDDTTLPEGFVQTFDIEGPLDHSATVDLDPGEDRDDVDFGYADECLPFIDFDTDGAGAGLSKGTVIDNQWAAFGVTVSTGDPSHLPMIFDSSMPTGGDPDLGTPNETFGGPGIGSGGEAGQPGENSTALGNVLIISEDNDSNDPDDNAGGGTITFDFAYPVRVDKVGILDIDEGAGGTVTAFDGAGSTIGSAAMANNLGNNSAQTVLLGVSGVRRLEVFFPGSGAVSEVIFCEPESECSPVQVRDNFETKSFSNNDGADNWSGDWIENDPEAGGAGPSAGQVQVHNGLLTLDDYPNTGGHPSAAREVDLTGAVSATLNFKFATSHGVDPGDAVTVEVSNDGGSTWSTLEVITGIHGAVEENRSFDISAFASSETQVRFRVSKYYGGQDELFCLLFVEIVSGCESCQEIGVRDNFETKSFSNNDGADSWSGDWIEDDPEAGGAGPAAGQVQVHNGLLTLDDYPNTGGHPSAAREVDLTGAANATLSFTFATSSGVDTSDAVTVEISNDGGASWSTLEVITGIHGAIQENRSYDISAFTSAETQVRFRVSKYYGGQNELFCLLFVEINTDCGPGGCQETTVGDDFSVESFSNNDGPQSWSGDWIENDPESGGAGPWSGQVRVLGGYLKLDDYPNTGGHPSAAREVDLSGASSAILDFDFRTTSGVDSDDAVAVEVSADGGASWTVLENITGISGSSTGWRTFDISGFVSSETQVRFRVSNKYGGSDETFKVDWVQITSDCP